MLWLAKRDSRLLREMCLPGQECRVILAYTSTSSVLAICCFVPRQENLHSLSRPSSSSASRDARRICRSGWIIYRNARCQPRGLALPVPITPPRPAAEMCLLFLYTSLVPSFLPIAASSVSTMRSNISIWPINNARGTTRSPVAQSSGRGVPYDVDYCECWEGKEKQEKKGDSNNSGISVNTIHWL